MSAARYSAAPSGGLLQREVVERLGSNIVTGMWPTGTVLHMDDLADQLGVSRSVIREAIGVLAENGLVHSRKHRGTVVQHHSSWNALASDVISWRLNDPAQRAAQFRSLVELRSAIEPHAAWLAAQRVDADQAEQLVGLATRMVGSGTAGNVDDFVAADLIFHRLVLQASGNPLFLSLEQILNEILAGKYRLGLMPVAPDAAASQHHLDLAEAIAAHDSSGAAEACRFIVQQSADELSARAAQES